MTTRASDKNKKRRLQYGQAIMLGCQFEQRWCVSGKGGLAWFLRLPNAPRSVVPYETRYAAVYMALHKLGVLN